MKKKQSFFSRLFGREQKSVTGSDLLWSFLTDDELARNLWSAHTYQVLANSGYIKCTIAFRCIRQRAEAIGALKWKIKNKRTGEVVENHPLLDLLKRPNPAQAQSVFFEEVQAYKDLVGDTFIRAISPTPSSEPRELQSLRPDRMTVERGAWYLPKEFVYKYNEMSKEMRFPVDQTTGKSEVLQIKNFHPLDDWRGLSPLRAAHMSVEIFNSAQTLNKKSLDNGARLGGLLSVEGELNKEQVEHLEERIREKYAGKNNSGRTLIASGGMKFTPMSTTFKDMEFVSGKEVTAREIALAYGVPPLLLNIQGDNTYANYKEARLAFYEDTVIPQASLLETELNNWLVPMFDDNLELYVCWDGVSALEPKRQILWDRAQQADYLTINEKRELCGFPPLKETEGDVLPNANKPKEEEEDNPNDREEDENE